MIVALPPVERAMPKTLAEIWIERNNSYKLATPRWEAWRIGALAAFEAASEMLTSTPTRRPRSSTT